MIALAVWMALAAAPPQVVIVKRSASGVANTTTATVMHAVGEALERRGLGVTIEVLTCAGDPPCLAEAARSSSAIATVAVTVVGGRRQLTIDLEAVDEAERALGVATFKVPLSGTPLPDEGLAFLDRFAAALVVPRRAADEPRVVTLEPPPVAAPLAVAVTAPRPSSAGLKIAGGGAIALGVATLGVLIAGMVLKSSLEDQLAAGPAARGLTREAASRQASLANGLFTTAAISGGLTTAAVATTGVLWLSGD